MSLAEAVAPETPAAPSEPAAPPPRATREAIASMLGKALNKDQASDTPELAPTPAADGDTSTADAAAGDKPEPLGKAFKALHRERVKLRDEKEAVTRARAEVDAKVRELSPRLALLDKVEAAKDDPRALLELFGHTSQSVLEHELRAGSPEAKLAALEKRIADREKREADERQAQERARAEQAHVERIEREKREFIEFALASVEHLPEFAKAAKRPQSLINDAVWAADVLRKKGIVPTKEVIGRELNIYYQESAEAEAGERTGQSPNPATEQATGQQPAVKPAAQKAPAKTISNRGAAETTGREKPQTDGERRRAAIAMLDAMRAQSDPLRIASRAPERPTNGHERINDDRAQCPKDHVPPREDRGDGL